MAIKFSQQCQSVYQQWFSISITKKFAWNESCYKGLNICLYLDIKLCGVNLIAIIIYYKNI